MISIHALQAESDTIQSTCKICGDHFNPRSPSGERHDKWVAAWGNNDDFNPRSPSGERPVFLGSG